MRAGEFVPPQDDGYDPEADVRAHQRPVIDFDSQVGKMKLLGMDVKTNMGVRMDGQLLDG